MSVAQGLMLSQEAQLAPQTGLWTYQTLQISSLYMPTNAPNFNNMFPGTQDFCWETWISPRARNPFLTTSHVITAWASGGNTTGPSASDFSLYFDTSGVPSGLMTVRAKLFSSQTIAITAVNPDLLFDGQWHHVAMIRSGTNVSVWWDGVLYGLIEDFTGDLNSGAVGTDGYWIASGPTGDRDQSFNHGIGAAFRNTRWTIGNSVYSTGPTITPPPLADNLPAVTGTQWVWWPQVTTDAFYGASGGISVNPWTPDVNPGNYQFTATAGDSTGTSPCQVGTVIPGNYNTTPAAYNYFNSDFVGTWTNEGPVGNEPKITNTGPTPIIGTTCADFTGTGTGVRIASTDSQLTQWTNTFFLTAWIYIPANITNECKTLIYCEGGTNNFVLNIGRPGQGLDWLSIYTSSDVEVAYAPHIWARNAWNSITIQKGTFSNTSIAAWAGANGDNYAKNLNMIGPANPNFDNATAVSIGSKPGSTVSCQMYINLIQQATGQPNNGDQVVYAVDRPTIPVQPWQYRKNPDGETFTFQGTNGSTNIQPISITGN